MSDLLTYLFTYFLYPRIFTSVELITQSVCNRVSGSINEISRLVLVSCSGGKQWYNMVKVSTKGNIFLTGVQVERDQSYPKSGPRTSRRGHRNLTRWQTGRVLVKCDSYVTWPNSLIFRNLNLNWWNLNYLIISFINLLFQLYLLHGRRDPLPL